VSALLEPPPSGVARFRAKLLVAMMLVVSAITATALFLAQRNLTAGFEQELQREFQAELAVLHQVQQLRDAALAERCRTLVRRSRIHAALEDDALDLLYPSAKDELRDIMAPGDVSGYGLHAEFYRFLDRHGAVIPADNPGEVGLLSAAEEARLALPTTPARLERGYLVRRMRDGETTLAEIITLPVFSNETGEVIAALSLGFRRAGFGAAAVGAGIQRGVWLDGRLHLDAPGAGPTVALETEIAAAIRRGERDRLGVSHPRGAEPHLLFHKQLNPGSAYPPAYEVCVYPVAELQARQRTLRWQVLGAGALLLLGGFGASHLLARRLARPVEALAVDSAENRVQRQRAEAALELTSEELQRAARFSADASHQLKTPVTVLRAGLEELLTSAHLTPEECREISALIHQTYRLSGVIEDLLLLSRMDAGRLKIDLRPVDLTALIAAALDDLDARADEQALTVETDGLEGREVAGDPRYLSLILQNLLENARKYNRSGGRVRVVAHEESGRVFVRVGNTGQPIPPAAQTHIFERFHRGAVGENVPGYGLGLNLARELARLHGGELRLLRSDDTWTEFEVSFRLATAAGLSPLPSTDETAAEESNGR
jgi:signal transduction histidine kinase